MKGLVHLKTEEERKRKQADEEGVTFPRGQWDRLKSKGVRANGRDLCRGGFDHFGPCGLQ